MTNNNINIEESNKARLAELQRLTGCPINLVIEGKCTEEGCQNSVLKGLEGNELSMEICERVHNLIEEDSCLLSKELALILEKNPFLISSKISEQDSPEPVIDIRPRLRCIL